MYDIEDTSHDFREYIWRSDAGDEGADDLAPLRKDRNGFFVLGQGAEYPKDGGTIAATAGHCTRESGDEFLHGLEEGIITVRDEVEYRVVLVDQLYRKMNACIDR
jgi:hypothetical protein